MMPAYIGKSNVLCGFSK